MSAPSFQDYRRQRVTTSRPAGTALRSTLRVIVSALTMMSLLLVISGAATTAAPVQQAFLSPAARLVPELIPPSAYLVSLTDHTARSDPEQLLGIPGQYVSKAEFADSDGVAGYVEMFVTTSDRLRREYALGGASEGTIIGNGRALLRLFYVYPPDPRIDAYRRAMGNVLVK